MTQVLRAADGPTTHAEALRYFLRQTSPRCLVALVVASVAVRLVLGGWSPWDLVLVAALVAWWPIQEWLIHVFILHYRPREVFGRTLDFDVPRKHRAHHRDPWRLDLVFIPSHVFLYAPVVMVGLFALLLPTWSLAFTGVAAYFALSLHYEWVHFLVHTRVKPFGRYYQRLWRNHRLHHCKNEHYWYGVTMLGGDRLLHTDPDHRGVALSPTCRTLGHADDLGVGGQAA